MRVGGSAVGGFWGAAPTRVGRVRLVVARCSVDYVGRLTAHLAPAIRVLMVKADDSVLVHSDGGSYKPLNWMSPPCWLIEEPGRWTVRTRPASSSSSPSRRCFHDSRHELGVDPGLVKDGVEAHLQILLAEHVATLGEGWSLVRREFPTPDRSGRPDVPGRGRRQRGGGDQATRRHRRRRAADQVPGTLNRDPMIAPVSGVFAAQQIKPQARTLATDRGIRCVCWTTTSFGDGSPTNSSSSERSRLAPGVRSPSCSPWAHPGRTAHSHPALAWQAGRASEFTSRLERTEFTVNGYPR